MAEFNARADSVDVTQIMARLREQIREQRDVDGPEQVSKLAAEALERCLAPRRARAEQVEHNRRLTPPGRFDRDPQGAGLAPEPFEFNADTVYVSSSRGIMGKLIRLIRRLLNPILRLFFNPDPIILAMMRQAEINARLLDLLNRVNAEFERAGRKFAAREELDALNYEVVNNLVVEMTRLAVDMKDHRMLVESVAGRLDFEERRARALESVRQNRSTPAADGAEGDPAAAPASRTRRRRRRSRRRPGTAAPNGVAEGADSPDGAAGEASDAPDAPAGASPERADAPDDAPAGGPPERADAPASGSPERADTPYAAAGGPPERADAPAGGSPERADAPDAPAAPRAADTGAMPDRSDAAAAPGEPSPSPSAAQTPPAEPPADAEDR